MDEMKRKLRAHYGDNKRIVGDDYDKSLAVKCLNGTFVGKKTDNVIAYRGIPFVARQPVGDLRWKAPVEYVPDDGIAKLLEPHRCKIEPLKLNLPEPASSSTVVTTRRGL